MIDQLAVFLDKYSTCVVLDIRIVHIILQSRQHLRVNQNVCIVDRMCNLFLLNIVPGSGR